MALSSAVVGWLRNAGVDSADINNVALSASKSALLTSMLDVAATKNVVFKILPSGQGGGGNYTEQTLSIAQNILSGPALGLGSYLSHELGHTLDSNGTRYLADGYSFEQALDNHRTSEGTAMVYEWIYTRQAGIDLSKNTNEVLSRQVDIFKELDGLAGPLIQTQPLSQWRFGQGNTAQFVTPYQHDATANELNSNAVYRVGNWLMSQKPTE